MADGKGIPGWLTRRGYFKRLGRWAKPRKRAAPARAIEHEAEPAPSNILRFPEPTGGPHVAPFAEWRGAGTG